MRLPPEIVEAKRKAESYRVKPAPYGRFYVTRFRPWHLTESGWRIVANVATREAARAEIEERLGLEAPQPKPPDEPMWFDWSGF